MWRVKRRSDLRNVFLLVWLEWKKEFTVCLDNDTQLLHRCQVIWWFSLQFFHYNFFFGGHLLGLKPAPRANEGELTSDLCPTWSKSQIMWRPPKASFYSIMLSFGKYDPFNEMTLQYNSVRAVSQVCWMSQAPWQWELAPYWMVRLSKSLFSLLIRLHWCFFPFPAHCRLTLALPCCCSPEISRFTVDLCGYWLQANAFSRPMITVQEAITPQPSRNTI